MPPSVFPFCEFQSTLPQGERPFLFCRQPLTKRFQSTLPQGERQPESIRHSCVFQISIHAPARGATPRNTAVPSVSAISIHAPARGATRLYMTDIAGFIFQSTLPQGERRCVCVRCGGQKDFNPRSRKGSDSKTFNVYSFFGISIHAPARGATIGKAFLQKMSAKISIHAPARGATDLDAEDANIL